MIKAVIFDFDGTLAKTLHVHFSAYRKALGGKKKITPMDIYSREGGRSVDIIADIAGKVPDSELRRMVSLKQKEYERLSGSISLYPGSLELLRKLRNGGMIVGLVTGTKRKNLGILLKEDETTLFDSIVTGDDVTKPKPDPQPYLMCMKALDVKPDETVVVENAPMGIESAKNANAKVIAVTSTLPEKYLKDADFIVGSITEVEKVLEKIKK